jgi:hypothetical protein
MVALCQNPEVLDFLNKIEEICGALGDGGTACPDPVHRFAPGLYIREQFMPKGALLLGHEHKGETLNIVLRGKARVFADGRVRVVTAPAMFTSGPGRKVGYMLEDTVWTNVLPNPDNERDIEKLEDRYVFKTEASRLREAQNRSLKT